MWWLVPLGVTILCVVLFFRPLPPGGSDMSLWPLIVLVRFFYVVPVLLAWLIYFAARSAFC